MKGQKFVIKHSVSVVILCIFAGGRQLFGGEMSVERALGCLGDGRETAESLAKELETLLLKKDALRRDLKKTTKNDGPFLLLLGELREMIGWNKEEKNSLDGSRELRDALRHVVAEERKKEAPKPVNFRIVGPMRKDVIF